MDEPLEAPWIAELLAELLDQHATSLELYAAQWTTTPADSVQQAFITLASLLQQAGAATGNLAPTNPQAWLYKTVRHQSLNAARAQRRRQHHERIAARLTESKHATQLTAAEQLPLIEALDNLEPQPRELVVLRIWSELTWQEIAELTGTSSSSAQRRYVAALTQLRQHLEPSCPPNPICRPN